MSVATVAPVLGRERELDAIDGLLDAREDGPSLLLFEGEPGIGKTTLARAAVERARARGTRVLACAGAVAEARLSYVALADLLADVDSGTIAALPATQRDALDAALLRADALPEAPSWRAVATALRSLLEVLSGEGPVLLAIDDAQWLDPPSARVVDVVASRLPANVGLIVTRRSDTEAGWRPQLTDRRAAQVRRVEALAPAAIAAMLRDRAPMTPTRSVVARVTEAAGGNPLHALELLRTLRLDEPAIGPLTLPHTLGEMVDLHLADVAPAVEKLLLAVAALAVPTLDVLREALGPDTDAWVDQAEKQGVLACRGGRVRFTSPLLAEGVLARAPATRRRAMHRRLSGIVTDLEDRARHLALGCVLPDALPALEAAALYTRARGAPAAAAELLERALELGGPPALKVRAAEHHLDAGDVPRAQALLEAAIAELERGEKRAEALVLLAELRRGDDSFAEARVLLEQARQEASAGTPLQVVCALQLVFVLYNLDRRAEAAEAAHAALALATRVGPPGLIAQALGVVATVDFAIGRGVDEDHLRAALELEDPGLRASQVFRPTLTASLVFAFAGRLDEAVALSEGLAREYAETGQEHDLAWLSARLVWLECWRGDLAGAEGALGEAEERLGALDTDAGRLLALTARAQVDAYAGRADSARRHAEEALALAEQTHWKGAIVWQLMTLGFVELSVGDHRAAAERLAPLAAAAIATGLPEPAADGALVHGDAAEALILADRVAEAEPLVVLLEQRGAALGRTWAIAVGARCRGLILAGSGDSAGAEAALRRALEAHTRLPMPIEHGRTLLALGRVQRRLRQRRAAKRTFERAQAIFDRAGSVQWAGQARTESEALGLSARPAGSLTAAEERVARMAATGLTNRRIASALQVSPRTVDAQLGRAYRKLDINSRAELGALMQVTARPGRHPRSRT